MKYFALITLLALSVLATPAHAYVLPTDYIVRLMLDAQAKHKISDVSLKLTADLKGEPQILTERLYLKSPERLRLVSEGESESLYIEREGTRAHGKAGALTVLKSQPTNLFATLKFPKGQKSNERIERLLEILTQAGIDTSITALGRFERKPAYIVGARAFEPDKPQIWIHKDRLQPMKTVLFTGPGATGKRVEYRFLDYEGSPAGSWFPRIIEMWEDNQLIKKQTVAEARTNEKLPETLFQTP